MLIFFHPVVLFLGLLCHRKFTFPTSLHETSTEIMWIACGGSATSFFRRYKPLSMWMSRVWPASRSPAFTFSCSRAKMPLCAGNQEKWRTTSIASSQTNQMLPFLDALITASVTSGTCASPWISGRRWIAAVLRIWMRIVLWDFIETYINDTLKENC